MKFVKTGAMFLVLIMCLTILGIQASAHPPGFMNIKYEENNLKILIIHFSISPFGSHYIYKLDIEVNGEPVETELYEQQQRFIFLFYNFEVVAEPGDEITATAYCSLFGQKEKSITL